MRVEGQQAHVFVPAMAADADGAMARPTSARASAEPRSHDPQAPQPEHRLGVPSRSCRSACRSAARTSSICGTIASWTAGSRSQASHREATSSRKKSACRPRCASGILLVQPAAANSDQLEEPVTRPTVRLVQRRQQRVLDQPVEASTTASARSGSSVTTASAAPSSMSRRTRRRAAARPFGLGEQAVAPADRRLEVSLPREPSGRPAGQERRPRRRGRSRCAPAAANRTGLGELDAERQAVEPADDGDDGGGVACGGLEAVASFGGSGREQLDGRRGGQRGNVGEVGVFGGEAEGWKLPGDLARHVDATRLVASPARFGHARNKSTARSATASTRCSPLSSARSTGSSPQAIGDHGKGVEVVPSTMPSDVATEVSTSSGSASEARSTDQAPPPVALPTSDAALMASLVFPDPPGPVRVARRLRRGGRRPRRPRRHARRAP